MGVLLLLLISFTMWRRSDMAVLVGLIALVVLVNKAPWWLEDRSLSVKEILPISMLCSPLPAVALSANVPILGATLLVAAVALYLRIRSQVQAR
jgi:hypothetical protein